MECPHAYLQRGIEYVLCDREAFPMRQNKADVAHAVCLHQAFCPKENCHKLSANWAKCNKLAVRSPERAQESAGAQNATKATNATPKKKTARKASDGSK